MAREDVVVVGRRAAARAGELRQPGARGGGDDGVVDVLPDRVERDEPLEQRRLLRVAARGVLVEVVVAVDQAGRGEHAAAVDPARAAGHGGRGPGPDRGDPAVRADDVAVRVLAPVGVDGGDRAALDDGDAHAGAGYSLRRSGRSAIDIDAADRLDRDAFVARFGGVFEESPWIAGAGLGRAPVRQRRRPARRDGRGRRRARRATDRLGADPRAPRPRRQGGDRRRADAGVHPRAGRRRARPADAGAVRAADRPHRRLPRALRLPVRRLRARAHGRLDHRRGRRARRPPTPTREERTALSEIAKIARLRLDDLVA